MGLAGLSAGILVQIEGGMSSRLGASEPAVCMCLIIGTLESENWCMLAWLHHVPAMIHPSVRQTQQLAKSTERIKLALGCCCCSLSQPQ